jgi:hypothetical protein
MVGEAGRPAGAMAALDVRAVDKRPDSVDNCGRLWIAHPPAGPLRPQAGRGLSPPFGPLAPIVGRPYPQPDDHGND